MWCIFACAILSRMFCLFVELRCGVAVKIREGNFQNCRIHAPFPGKTSPLTFSYSSFLLHSLKSFYWLTDAALHVLYFVWTPRIDAWHRVSRELLYTQGCGGGVGYIDVLLCWRQLLVSNQSHIRRWARGVTQLRLREILTRPSFPRHYPMSSLQEWSAPDKCCH